MTVFRSVNSNYVSGATDRQWTQTPRTGVHVGSRFLQHNTGASVGPSLGIPDPVPFRPRELLPEGPKTSPQRACVGYFSEKMSFDFHILYDSIIHTLQNRLPFNLITVTLISHKYANTSEACREQRRL